MSGVASKAKPVMLPPGCARLATKPRPTGSVAVTMTIGTVVVARLATSMKGAGPVTMALTWRLSRSATAAGSRSIVPEYRSSMRMFRLRIQPSSLRPSSWAFTYDESASSGGPTNRTPILGRSVCWVCAASGTATTNRRAMMMRLGVMANPRASAAPPRAARRQLARASRKLPHLCLGLLQPVRHTHLAVYRHGGDAVLLRLLQLAHSTVELAETEVAVGDERAHAERLGERQSLLKRDLGNACVSLVGLRSDV